MLHGCFRLEQQTYDRCLARHRAVQAIQMAEPSGVQADFAAMTASRNGHPLEMSNGSHLVAQLQIHAFDAFQWILSKQTHTYIYVYK